MNRDEYSKLNDSEKDEYVDELLALGFEESDRRLIEELKGMPEPPEIKGGFDAIMAEHERREYGKTRYIPRKLLIAAIIAANL